MKNLYPWADRLIDFCSIASPSGNEMPLVTELVPWLEYLGAKVSTQVLAPNRANILAEWGQGGTLFTTHLDTVPPQLPVVVKKEGLWARGACDAKGQMVMQIAAIQNLRKKGIKNLSWLGVAGEESDSVGANAARKWKCLRKPWLAIINSEPTENKLTISQKGLTVLRLSCKGKPAHSGYPQLGENALFPFLDWIRSIQTNTDIVDPQLAGESWNLGHLHAPNPHNVVPDLVQADIAIRTLPDGQLAKRIEDLRPDCGHVETLLREPYFRFHVLPDWPAEAVAFGSDAPTLAELAPNASIFQFGPGNIHVAHTDNEHILWSDLEKGIELCESLALQIQPVGAT